MKKILYKSLALVFATVALSSCLKDDSYVIDPEKAAANVIDFQNPTDIAAVGTSNPLYIYSFPIVSTPTSINLTVSYSGAEDAAPKDITVNIGVAAQAVIDTYNEEQTKAFTMMPSSWYTLSATSVVIPKGQKTATFKLNISTTLIDLTGSYVVPLKLTSADAVVSTNFGTVLINVGAKNKYDGVYKWVATQSATDRASFLMNTEYTYGYDTQLRSAGANSNNLWNAAFGGFFYSFGYFNWRYKWFRIN
jgi:hypothetical protein